MKGFVRSFAAAAALVAVGALGGCVDSTPAGEAVLEGRETGDYQGISGTPDTATAIQLEPPPAEVPADSPAGVPRTLPQQPR
jgi:hypothetical protein